MPTYTFMNTKTGEIWTEFMSIQARDDFLQECPYVEQQVSAPAIVSGVNTFGSKKKPDSAFRDKLKEIKKRNPRSTINTY